MWIILSMSNCVYIYLEEECKVLGPNSDTKWVIWATTEVADTANKTPNLSSVFLCFYCIYNFLDKCT